MSSNPQYLCPDDTVCQECGRKLPEDTDLGAPSDEGFCDERCQQGLTGVNSLWDLAKHIDAWGANLADAVASRVYRRTKCGAGFRTVTNGIAVSGYIEGWDGDCPDHFLAYPFHIDDFFAALDACDREADEIWDLVREPETADQALRQVVLDPESCLD